MSTTKPTKPNSTLPDTWGGTKTAYTSTQIANGYEANVEEVIDGGNLNYSLTGIFERVKYLTDVVDIVNATPVGKTIVVDSNNKYDYIQPADDTNTVHKTGTESIGGDKTFSGNITFSNTITGSISGNAVNDGNGNEISETYMNKNASNITSTGKENIDGFGMPNYSAAVSKSKDTLYTADSNGYLIGLDYYGYTGSATCYVYIDGVNVRISSSQDNYATNTWCYPIAKGSEYSFSGGAYMAMQFVPCIGG